MKFFLIAASVVGCSTHRNHLEVLGERYAETNLQVAEPIFLSDHIDGDPFRNNTVVGNLTFSGGYVQENTGQGLFNVSKNVEITAVPLYRQQVSDWLVDVAGPPTLKLDSPPPIPKARHRRGTTSRDGKDNVSLPRLMLTPVPGGTFDRPTLVPWVVTYTSHNAGWFFGQDYGTPGGARIRVLLVAYAADGSILGFQDVDGSRISERIFSPTGPQLQDMLIVLEKRVQKKLSP